MLSDRRQRVLSALIEEYIARALPVGSRTLVDRYQLGVSPATVRNELSILEYDGYIVQPHTSAGRIPTDAGYRAFVDELIASGITQEESPHGDMISELRARATELDSLLEETSAALSRLTDCLSIVLAPSVLSHHIKQLSLVSLNDYQALVVVITEDGQVLNRHLDFNEPVTCNDLAYVQNILNKNFVGKTLHEIKQEVDKDLMEALKDPLVVMVLEEIVACLQENRIGSSHQLGVSSLLRKPEFSHSHSLLPIMQVLEDETVLLHIVEEEFLEKDTIVKIGHENNSEELSGVSVVAGQYGKGDAAGVIAVIGPTRMDYSNVIKAVRAAQNALQDI